jgi:hypothetical protein
MTIIVTLKVTDGLVLAADSAATFYVSTAAGIVTKIYNHNENDETKEQP